MKIVQIGANRANDDLSQLIGKNQPEILLLIEPIHFHNQSLKSFYSWVSNLIIENVAISEKTNQEIDFFYHLDDGPGYEVASLDPKHIYEKHKHLHKDRISSIKIKTININELFEKYNLKSIDTLFIDAEGTDELILRTINFDFYNIDKIFFENLHIKDLNVYNYLESKNYKINKNVGTNGWCSLAEKNK
jgi:FkbM family methyltransferase